VHPEGAAYYHQSENASFLLVSILGDPQHLLQNIFTEANIRDPHIRSLIEHSLKLVVAAKTWRGDSFPYDAEIVLELPPPSDPEAQCYYYCVNHQERTLFWMDINDLDNMLEDARGITSMEHISTLLCT
jgi:hypothetical protein